MLSSSDPREPERRLSELSYILAAGLLRLSRRAAEQSPCSNPEKVGLDFTRDQSVCANVSEGEKESTCGNQC